MSVVANEMCQNFSCSKNMLQLKFYTFHLLQLKFVLPVDRRTQMYCIVRILCTVYIDVYATPTYREMHAT